MIKHQRALSTLLILLLLGLACGPGSRLTGSTPTAASTPTAEPTIVAATTPTLPPNTTEPSTPTAPAQTSPSSNVPVEAVVEILALDQDGDPSWSGSGSIVAPEGYILTNAHVAIADKGDAPVTNLLILLTQKEDEPPVPSYLAEPVIVDQDLDLAILRITSDAKGNPVDSETLNLPYMQLGNSDEVHLGTPLRILGYPGIGGKTITLTSGEVAGFTSEPGIKGRAFLKTSATIAGGNSGGAGVNNQGELIGVPTQLGAGGKEDEIVDCRVLADTNADGVIDENDACIPTGGFINALRPINWQNRSLPGPSVARRTLNPTRLSVRLIGCPPPCQRTPAKYCLRTIFLQTRTNGV